MYKERGLDPVPLVDKDQVVVRPQREEDTGQVSNSEIVFRALLIDDDPFEDQGSSYPLATSAHFVRQPGRNSAIRGTLTYIVHLTPIVCISIGPSDASKAREEPLCHSTDGIGSWLLLVDLRFARGDVEP